MAYSHHQGQGYQLAGYPPQQQQYLGIEQYPSQYSPQYGSEASLHAHQEPQAAAAYGVGGGKTDSSNGRQRTRPWQPGFFRRLPWGGVAALILSIVCQSH